MARRAFRKFPDRPFWRRMLKNDSCWTESKAFFRSTKHVYSLPPLFDRLFSTIALSVRMWSVVEYPCLNQFLRLAFFSPHETTLLFSTNVYHLLIKLSNEIPPELSMLFLFPFMKIWIIIAFDHSSGYSPSLQTALKSFVRNLTAVSSGSLIDCKDGGLFRWQVPASSVRLSPRCRD